MNKRMTPRLKRAGVEEVRWSEHVSIKVGLIAVSRCCGCLGVLSGLNAPQGVVSLLQFFGMVAHWPDELPAADGDALVVTGLEGCLDVLSGEDTVTWIEAGLKEAVLSFQDFYQGQAGLILWTPSGRNRITMKGASEEHFWKHRDLSIDGLPIGRLLFSGAENEVEHLATGGYVRVFFPGGERQVFSESLNPATSRAEQIITNVQAGADLLRAAWLCVEAHALPMMENAAVLTSARIDLLPHQVVLTHQVATASTRRFLVADEVGIGKTIETALILHELTSRGELNRAVMVVPAGLVNNWHRELNQAFNLDFEVFGAEGDLTDRKNNAFARHVSPPARGLALGSGGVRRGPPPLRLQERPQDTQDRELQAGRGIA